MSDYPKSLPVPNALLYYGAGIRVICSANDKSVESNSGVGDGISIPKGFECKPLVTVQAYGADNKDVGPCWCFDYEADQGRGVWVLYDENLHKIPSKPLPDAEPSCQDYLKSERAMFESESLADAPNANDPPCRDDSECDEPSSDADDEDDDGFSG